MKVSEQEQPGNQEKTRQSTRNNEKPMLNISAFLCVNQITILGNKQHH